MNNDTQAWSERVAETATLLKKQVQSMDPGQLYRDALATPMTALGALIRELPPSRVDAHPATGKPTRSAPYAHTNLGEPYREGISDFGVPGSDDEDVSCAA